MKEPKVSVVIPCLNEEKHIKTCIRSIFGNGYPKDLLEIIVVDGMSSDGTLSILNKLKIEYDQLKIVENPKTITPVSLNLGLHNASSQYVLIASAHSSFDKNYIEILINALENTPGAIGVGGPMKTLLKNETKISCAIQEVLQHRFGVGNSIFRTGSTKKIEVDTVPFGLYKKEVLVKAGGYDEKLVRNHDMELSKRLTENGGKIYLIPETSCNYFARETYRELSSNNYKNGKWNLLTVFITRRFSSLSARHFIPMLFVLSLTIPSLLSFLYFPFIYLSALSLLLYVLGIIYFSACITSNKTTFFHLFFGFLSLHFSYGLGSLMGLLSIPFVKKA